MTTPVSGEAGVLVLTHGSSGGAMLSTVRVLLSAPLDSFMALGVGNGDARESVVRQIEDALVMLDGGSGVLIVCDLYGATPMNCALEQQRAGRLVAVVTGLNLAMLVKLASLDRSGMTPEQLAHKAAETAARSIREAKPE